MGYIWKIYIAGRYSSWINMWIIAIKNVSLHWMCLRFLLFCLHICIAWLHCMFSCIDLIFVCNQNGWLPDTCWRCNGCRLSPPYSSVCITVCVDFMCCLRNLRGSCCIMLYMCLAECLFWGLRVKFELLQVIVEC